MDASQLFQVADTGSVTSVRGEPVHLFERGPYRYDSLSVGAGNRGTYSLGTAYNELYLLYVVLFSASLFALLKAFGSFGAAEITYTAGEVIGPLSGFVLSAVVAVGYLLSVLRGVPARGRSAP